MAKIEKIKKIICLNLKKDSDLLKSIENYCTKENIKIGFLFAIGALKEAKISYYDQKKKKYFLRFLKKPLEIVSCLGNISLKNNKPFVHAHITLADRKNNTYGGHANEGCIVFAAECFIFQLEDNLLKRKFNEETGLFLWDFFN